MVSDFESMEVPIHPEPWDPPYRCPVCDVEMLKGHPAVGFADGSIVQNEWGCAFFGGDESEDPMLSSDDESPVFMLHAACVPVYVEMKLMEVSSRGRRGDFD